MAGCRSSADPAHCLQTKAKPGTGWAVCRMTRPTLLVSTIAGPLLPAGACITLFTAAQLSRSPAGSIDDAEHAGRASALKAPPRPRNGKARASAHGSAQASGRPPTRSALAQASALVNQVCRAPAQTFQSPLGSLSICWPVVCSQWLSVQGNAWPPTYTLSLSAGFGLVNQVCVLQ